jgi:hypothetical protein
MDWVRGQFVVRTDKKDLCVIQSCSNEIVQLLDHQGDPHTVERQAAAERLVPFEATSWKKDQKTRDRMANGFRSLAANTSLPTAYRLRAAAWASAADPSFPLIQLREGEQANSSDCESLDEMLIVIEWGAKQQFVFRSVCRDLIVDETSDSHSKRALSILSKYKLTEAWWKQLEDDLRREPPSPLGEARLVRFVLDELAPPSLLKIVNEDLIREWLTLYKIASQARPRRSRAEAQALEHWCRIIHMDDEKFATSHALKTADLLSCLLFGGELHVELYGTSPSVAKAALGAVTRALPELKEARQFLDNVTTKLPLELAAAVMTALVAAGNEKPLLELIHRFRATNRLADLWREMEKCPLQSEIATIVARCFESDMSEMLSAENFDLVDQVYQLVGSAATIDPGKRSELSRHFRKLKTQSLVQQLRPASGNSLAKRYVRFYADDASEDAIKELAGQEMNRVRQRVEELLFELEKAQKRIAAFGQEQASLQKTFEKRLTAERDAEAESYRRSVNEMRLKLLRAWCNQVEDWSTRKALLQNEKERDILADIITEAEARLREQGVVPIGQQGEVVCFDPSHHQVVGTIDKLKVPVEIKRRGFILEYPGASAVIIQPALVRPMSR